LEDGRWKETPAEVENVWDPVCGMAFPADRAAATRSAASRTFSFCSDLCVEKFDREPDAFSLPIRSGTQTGR
jgi:YHS domain-containing protein